MIVIKQGKSERPAPAGASAEFLQLIYPDAELIISGDNITENEIDGLLSAKIIKYAGGLWKAFELFSQDDSEFMDFRKLIAIEGAGLKIKYGITKATEKVLKALSVELLRFLAKSAGVKYNQSDAKAALIKKIQAAQSKIFK